MRVEEGRRRRGSRDRGHHQPRVCRPRRTTKQSRSTTSAYVYVYVVLSTRVTAGLSYCQIVLLLMSTYTYTCTVNLGMGLFMSPCVNYYHLVITFYSHPALIIYVSLLLHDHSVTVHCTCSVHVCKLLLLLHVHHCAIYHLCYCYCPPL